MDKVCTGTHKTRAGIILLMVLTTRSVAINRVFLKLGQHKSMTDHKFWEFHCLRIPTSQEVTQHRVKVWIQKLHFHKGGDTYQKRGVTVIGASLSEPHHMRSSVKSVFLLACLKPYHIWLKTCSSANKHHIKYMEC